jgi:hypothetical protein
MGYTEILAEIYAELNLIVPTDTANFATIGNIHDCVRIQNVDNTRITFKKDGTGAVCPEWFLTRINVDPESEEGTLEGIQHTFILRGYYPVNDANQSEKLFQVLIDDILAHFRYKYTLDGVVWRIKPPAMTRFESVAIMLDGTYVHYCEITFKPFEYAESD